MAWPTLSRTSSGHRVRIGRAQKPLGGEAHTFQNLVPAKDGPRHAVERHCQALDLISAMHFGASVQIPLRHFPHGGLEDSYGPNQTRGIDQGDRQAQEAAEKGQGRCALIGAPHALVVGIQRQADVNPAPWDAAVVERERVLENAAAEQR